MRPERKSGEQRGIPGWFRAGIAEAVSSDHHRMRKYRLEKRTIDATAEGQLLQSFAAAADVSGWYPHARRKSGIATDIVLL